MKNKTLSRSLYVSISIGLLVIIAMGYYSVQNKSGHTSFDPYLANLVFIPVAFSGLFSVLNLMKQGKPVKLAVISFLVGLFGILFLVYLDKTNTLLNYEVWLDRGMP